MSRRKSSKKNAARSVAPASQRRLWWIPALIIVAGVWTYANTFTNPFLIDDTSTVLNNPTIRDLSSWSVLQPPANHPMSGRPLVNLSFALNYAAGGTGVWGYHAVGLALHLACGLLVFGLAGRQLSTPMAGAVALLWTVHPLNSEAVNYITQRTELMMAACFLATLYAASARGEWRPRGQIVAVIACAVGMACKETMAVAPLAVLLYDSAYEYGSPVEALRARWRFYLCLAGTWLIVGVLTATSGQSLSAGYTFARPDGWVYLLNQGVIILQYLRLALWPDALVIYYGWPREVGLAAAWPSVALVGALFVLTIVTLIRRPRIGALAVWVFLTLGPTSSFIPIVTEVGAERRMYLPMVGIVTLAVVGVAWLWSRVGALRAMPRWAPAALVAVVAVAYSFTSRNRNQEYASQLTIAETALARWPTPYASHLVGAALVDAGRAQDALPHLRNSVPAYPMAYLTLADALLKTGHAREAIPEAETFLRIAPPPAIRNAEMLLANAYMASGEPARAIDQLAKVLEQSPRFATARALIADLLAEAGRFGEAIPHYQALLAITPNVRASTGLGIALVAVGRGAEAVAPFRAAAEAEPQNVRYRQNLARALVEHGDAADALKHAQEAVSLDATDPVSFELLGRALVRLGRIADARLSFERALRLDPSYAPAIAALRAIGR